MKKLTSSIFKLLPFAIIIAFIIFIVASGKKMTVDGVLEMMPRNLFLAFLAIIAMYALKSMSIIFPILVLQIAAGLIFPMGIALVINCIGTAVAYTIPYLIGRFSGSALADRLMEKYPKARDFVDRQWNSNSFLSFILRAVSCLPADIVSLYLGSIKIPYRPYIIWGVIGTLPGLIPATVVGTQLTNPKSPAFIISVAVTILSSVISIVLYKVIRDRKKTI